MSIHRLRFLPTKNVLYVLRLICIYILYRFGHVLLSIMHQELFLTENDHFHAMFITNYNWLKIICCQFVMKKKDFFYNFICVLVSKANTAVTLRKPKSKSNSYIFRWDPSFFQLTKVLKCTVFQKYKIRVKKENPLN